MKKQNSNLRAGLHCLVVASAAVFCAAMPLAAIAVDAREMRQFDIKPQPLTSALLEFSKQADRQVVGATETLRDVRTPGVSGELSVGDALGKLLQGTGLQYEMVGEHSVRIVGSADRAAHAVPVAEDTSQARLARMDVSNVGGISGEGDNGAQGEQNSISAETEERLDEIVVTAQKRAQRLKDVPISITAKSGDELEAARISNVLDLSFAVPSLAVAETGPGRQIISIRGIGSERGSSSLTGVYLDEMPVSGAQDGGIQSYLDLRTLDLERVEVLKGPQGTLFGEGAVGGVVRYITKEPVLDNFGGRLAPAIYRTSDGDWSEEFVGIVNLPLVRDVFGLRVAGTYEDKSGWIDQPLRGRADINDSELYNVRVKALWLPTQKLKVAGMINVHRNDGGGSNVVNQEPHDDSIFLQALGWNGQTFDRLTPTDYTDEYELYNLTATYDLGFAELLSSTSHAALTSVQSLTQLLGGLPTPSFEVLLRHYEQDAAISSQDLRLISTGTGPLDWTIGAAYKDAKMIKAFGEAGADGIFAPPAPGDEPARGILANSAAHGDSQSWAAYADASYKLTHRLMIGGGLRYFYDQRESFDELNAAATFLSAEFDAVTFRAYASYFLSDDVHLYVNVADGFRSGGFNAPGFISLGAPATYDPEAVISYEAGIKTAFLNGRLSFDTAVFYSEYEDMQDDTFDTSSGTFIQFTTNGQAAEVAGVEWALSWRASDHLSLGLSGDITESEITKVTSGSSYAVGDPINFTPDHKVAATATYDFNWGAATPGFLRVDFSRQGKSFYALRTAAPGLPLQSVAPQVDFLNASLGAEHADWELAIFGKNLTDERGIIRPGATGLTAQARPRTIGISVGRKF
jgi:iron complex outermembrane recepter protein